MNKKHTKPEKTYLSGGAFMHLLISSAEVFRKESLGYLLGYHLEDRYIIEHAFSLQTAMRRRRGVLLRNKYQKRIELVLSKFENLQIIGDFHSHTQYGDSKGLPILSPEDIKSMEPNNLYIIIAINEIHRKRTWKENRDGSISGSVGDLFLKISAYYLHAVGIKPLTSPIFCPFPPGF